MGKNSKNIRTSLNDFLSYLGKRLTPGERNSFEKELQRDPFAAEAAEGFESITAGEALEDMTELQKRLKGRASSKNAWMVYRIAASVTVLMVISSVVFIVWRSQNIKSDTVTQVSSPEFLITGAQPIKPESGKDNIPEEPKERQEPVKEKELAEVARSEEAAGAAPAIAKSETAGGLKPVDSAAARGLAAIPDAISEAEVPVMPSRAPSMAKAAVRMDREIRGKVISSEDNLPLPGASVVIKGTNIGAVTDVSGNFRITLPEADKKTLLAAYIGMESKEFQATGDSLMEVKLNPSLSALDEVVVVGYGVAKRSLTTGEAKAVSETDHNPYEYIPPEPAMGQEQFGDYVENNMIHPGELKEGRRAVVVLGFKVRTDGSLSNIMIIRSPGEAFSSEAIRLIREGPAWKPAMENGIPVEDDVRIRFVFR